MEANSLFHTVLLSLGFQVFIAGARVYNSAAERYGGFSHCNNIVIIGGERWMVDVGFGANGPTIPLPLRHDEPQTHIQGTPSLVRLMYESIPQNVDQGQKLWIYQHRLNHDPTSKWTPMYCFVDFEFLLEDINGMNLSPWKSPHSWFTQKVVLTRFTTDSEILHRDVDTPQITSEGTMTEGSIDGTLILFQDTVKWRRGGETKLQIKLESEEDRIGALWKYFDIELEDEDREAIRGTVSEIKCEFRPFG
ncbi:hypothetical protein F5Y04DRAFT_259740 [Hypomontagnella monticulosa]|nr:hypothetical protein F5Y04DRAFT_259740 [Hypomontagnella monticulosa]